MLKPEKQICTRFAPFINQYGPSTNLYSASYHTIQIILVSSEKKQNSLFFQHNSQTLWYHLCLITLLYQRLFDTNIWCRVIEWYIITINSKQIEYIFIKNAITFHKLMHLSYHHCSVLERVYGWLVDNLMITLELSWSGLKKWKYKEDKCT